MLHFWARVGSLLITGSSCSIEGRWKAHKLVFSVLLCLWKAQVYPLKYFRFYLPHFEVYEFKVMPLEHLLLLSVLEIPVGRTTFLYLFLIHVVENRMAVALNNFHLHEETSAFLPLLLWMIVVGKMEVEVCWIIKCSCLIFYVVDQKEPFLIILCFSRHILVQLKRAITVRSMEKAIGFLSSGRMCKIKMKH